MTIRDGSSGQLDLTRDLCAHCGEPIEQPRTGRRRRTCGDRCRQALRRRRAFDGAIRQVDERPSQNARQRHAVESFRDTTTPPSRSPDGGLLAIVLEEARRWLSWGHGLDEFIATGRVPPACIAGRHCGPGEPCVAYARGSGVGVHRTKVFSDPRAGELYLSWARIRELLAVDARSPGEPPFIKAAAGS